MVSRRKGQGWLSAETDPATAHTSWLICDFAQPLVNSFVPYWGPLHVCYTSRSPSGLLPNTHAEVGPPEG